MSDVTKRLMRVAASGVGATTVDVGALIFLVEVVGCHVTLAAFLAAVLGGITNFVINKYWAFADRTPLEIRQLTLYAVVSLVTAAFTATSLHILAVVIGVPYLIAKAVAAGLVFFLWTYPAQARIVFPCVPVLEPDAADSMPELVLD